MKKLILGFTILGAALAVVGVFLGNYGTALLDGVMGFLCFTEWKERV